MTSTVHVAALESGAVEAATAIAHRLKTTYAGELDDWRTYSGASTLLLCATDGSSFAATGSDRRRPLKVDFTEPGLLRRARGGIKAEALARAVGLSGKRSLQVVDTTAGLGKDAFLLAALGCEMTLIERNAVVAALLADGLARARSCADTLVRSAADRMCLIQCDGRDWLQQDKQHKIDVVTIDPMFNSGRGSAAAGREMSLLQCVAEAGEDEKQLLDAARALEVRVVVKRAKKARSIGGLKPTHQIKGSSARFDVYLPAI